MAADVDRARVGRGRCGAGAAAVERPGARPVVPGVRAVDHRRHPDGGLLAVPVPDAVVDQSPSRPDGLGCVVQPPDAVDHGDRGGHLPADRDALHRLGVSRDARQGHP
ncbi:hypothetical protein G6F24_018211 [Rhizopus arrhizus]|nr:hypothetical protein G6F24_018211 [Rhizopus arrhizus]